MTQYRIYYWEGARRYCTVIGTSDLEHLTRYLKQQYNRVIIEEIRQ